MIAGRVLTPRSLPPSQKNLVGGGAWRDASSRPAARGPSCKLASGCSPVPHHAGRNLEAARRLEKIRDGLPTLPTEVKREFEGFARDRAAGEALWEEWHLQIGMILPPDDAGELVKAIRRRIARQRDTA